MSSTIFKAGMSRCSGSYNRTDRNLTTYSTRLLNINLFMMLPLMYIVCCALDAG